MMIGHNFDIDRHKVTFIFIINHHTQVVVVSTKIHSWIVAGVSLIPISLYDTGCFKKGDRMEVNLEQYHFNSKN
jgi:hypothetical protein